MKNLYQILNISPTSNLKNILIAYSQNCLKSPELIFTYTNALSILVSPFKRMLYDASLYNINCTLLSQYFFIYKKLQEIDEYELANFIRWLEDFKNYFYDLKYFINNPKYNLKIEEWYNTLDNVIENLKSEIKSFYLT